MVFTLTNARLFIATLVVSKTTDDTVLAGTGSGTRAPLTQHRQRKQRMVIALHSLPKLLCSAKMSVQSFVVL